MIFDLSTISTFIFISCTLLVLGIQQMLVKDRHLVEKRIKKITSKELKQKLAEMYRDTEHKELWRQLLSKASRISLMRRLGKPIENELSAADLPLRGEEFITLVLFSGLTSGLFIFTLTLNLALGLLIGVACGIFPFLFLRMAKQKRLARFNGQITDALVITANSLRSGFSFLQAMDMVRRELPDPLSKEFGRTFKEINLGTATEEALINLTERVKSEDLDLVITAVLIQRQVGGNLAEVLDNIAQTIRERIRIKGEIRTLTAQGRISGLVIGLLPVILAGIMLFINPSYITSLFSNSIGLTMVLAAVIGELTGILIIKKIVNIDY